MAQDEERSNNHTDVMGQLSRVLRLFRILQTEHGPTRRRIAEELEVHPRTVTRYLTTLDAAGFHLRTDVDGNFLGRVQFAGRVHGTPLELLVMSREELMWLYFHLCGVHHIAPDGVQEHLWERVSNVMAGEEFSAPQIKAMLTAFQKGFKSYDEENRRETIAKLIDALYRQKACKLTYQTPNRSAASSFDAEPYHLFEFDNGLYVYCHLPWAAPDANRILMLAVERIEGVTLLGDFARDATVLTEIETRKERAFRINDDGSPLKFSVRFTAEAAPYAAARVWHGSQQPTQHRDGSLTLAFEASGWNEIVAWILGWGPACRVEKPDALREEVKRKLEDASAQYQ